MGGWDYYCCLCATPLHVPYEFDEGEEIEASEHMSEDGGSQQDYRPEDLFPKEAVADRIQWLSKFRTIGQNRHATGLTQCYLSGPAEEDEYGQAVIQRGEHPNAQSLTDDRVNCYRNEDEENGDLPVHDRCFAILCKVFAQAQGSDCNWTSDQATSSLPLDLDALFACLASRRRDGSFLNLNHTFEPDQYAWGDWKRIYDYFDPCESLKGQPDVVESDTDTTATASQQYDGCSFHSLPQELLDHILDFLPQADLVSLIKASTTIRRATKTNRFWKHRLRLDAPWLWEHHDNMDTIDWQKLYKSVMMQVHKPFAMAAKGVYVSGLANRKRIWHVCEQVLELYLETNTPRQQEASMFDEAALCRYLPMVANQEKPQYESDTAFFFTTHSEMHSAKHLKLRWNANGALCGISVNAGAGDVTFGDCSHGTDSAMDIQPGDWIEKMVLNVSIVEAWKTSTPYGERNYQRLAVTGVAVWQLAHGVTIFGKDEGYKRLLEPLPGNGIVGLKSQSAEGKITHLGLLEHPAGPTSVRPANDPKRLDLLWSSYLPPTDLRFKEYYTGYGMGSSGRDLLPMETLLFGSTDREQSTMIGFGASGGLGRLEIYRSNGSCERVGSGDGHMKVFNVDGPGGERILGFETTVGRMPVGLTLITTHGRQAIFGRRRDNTTIRETAEHGLGISGLYCSFGFGLDREMSSVGLVQSPHMDRPPMGDDLMRDGNGLLWEPNPPPPSWLPSGQVYGATHKGEVAVCIDFSRPISKIDGLFPAPEWLDIIEIGGFTITYSDGDPLEPVSHLGYFPQQWPTESDATSEILRSMQRHAGMSCFRRVTDTGRPHVLTDEDALAQPKTWDLGKPGEKIVAVTVWADDFLCGLQFHSEGGHDSPRWGKCGGDPSVTIRAGGESNTVGLKVILGSERLGFLAATLSPQAVQAMCEERQ